jgi:hypothetical protein
MYLRTRIESVAESIFGRIESGSAKKPVMVKWNGVLGSSLERRAHGINLGRKRSTIKILS